MIMIVDDNAQMRTVIKKFLEHADIADQFYECSSGEEAIQACTSLPLNWILMDIKMKEMDGLSATREIKRISPTTNVIIVTNFNDPDLREEAKQAGAFGYVLKENLKDIKLFIK